MNLADLKDNELLNRLKALVRQEREDTADVLDHLAEVDRRKLAQDRGYPSLFEYCVKELGYSEPSAYHRIRAARAIRTKPELLDLLRRGEIHLRAIVLLHPHLEDQRADGLVQQACGKSQREVEALLAPLSPEPITRDMVRIVTVKAPAADDMPLFASAPAPDRTVEDQSRVHVSFLANPSLIELLERARELLRHKYPDGRLEGIFSDALKALLEIKDPNRWKPARRDTESSTRKIPLWVKQEVFKRDQGQCAFEADDGRRCGSRDGLEFNHIVPWALGGTSNDPKNIRLLCRGHNQLMACRAGLSRPGQPKS